METSVLVNYKVPHGFQEDDYDYYIYRVSFRGKTKEEVRDIVLDKSCPDYGYHYVYNHLSWLTDEFRELIEDQLGVSSWNFESVEFYHEKKVDLLVSSKLKNGKLLSIKRQPMK